MSRPLLGQDHFQTLFFDDMGAGGLGANSGTFNQNDTLTLAVYLTYAPYSTPAYHLWLETQALSNFANSLSITSVTNEFPFPTPFDHSLNPAPFDSSIGASSGYLATSRDLGGALNLGSPPPHQGTWLVTHITFAITDAPLGTYIMQSTTVAPKNSRTDDTGNPGAYNIPAFQYTFNIVPEPSTAVLLLLSAIGVGTAFCRRRHSAQAAERKNT